MSVALLTLTTDFGEGSGYVAALKGVLLGINPAARLVDLGHSIPPQDVRHAAFFLASCVPYFPSGTIHVVVVDPGVGTQRALLYVEAGGQQLLAPDNGCWALAAKQVGGPSRVRRLTEPRFWRQPVSATFHGRDILAPVAAHLGNGVDPAELGPEVGEWVSLELPEPDLRPDRLRGEIVFVDPFGNLLSNVPGEAYLRLAARAARVRAGGHEIGRHVRAYGEAPPGEAVALVSSGGWLEIAVANGNAARQLGLGVGAPVVVEACTDRP